MGNMTNRKDYQIVLDVSGSAVLPLEVHEIIVTLKRIEKYFLTKLIQFAYSSFITFTSILSLNL